MSKHNLKTLLEMSLLDQEIAMGTDLLGVKKVKRGYEVTMGIDDNYGAKLIDSVGRGDGKYVAVVIVVNYVQFKKQESKNDL